MATTLLDARAQTLCAWACAALDAPQADFQAITNDASFRRYFRIRLADGVTYIAMDAPPGQEDCRPFMEVAARLASAGLNVPKIVQADVKQGFLLLTDLGDTLYLPQLQSSTVERLYGDAISTLAAMQVCVATDGLPLYNHTLLRREMELFPDWFLAKHLDLHFNAEQLREWEHCMELLCDSALQQPQVFVHRDYHSRNLLLHKHNPAILDFQDAVKGALLYDLVSLLRDVYIAWPPAQVRDWALGYYDLAQQTGLLPQSVAEETFLRWFDWMGLQRHLKVAGIFARLWHRDGKPAYLRDIPLTLRYIEQQAQPYPEFAWLLVWLRQTVLPAWQNQIHLSERCP